MNQIRIYFDEDAMDSDLVAALRSRGVQVITPAEVGLIGKTDDEQLIFATERECVLYTFNVCDFYRLHAISPANPITDPRNLFFSATSET